MGRIGKFFVYEWVGVVFDIMMVVKGIGGGFFLGVVLVIENVVFGMMMGIYGLIYGGNLLVCVVGNVVMDEVVIFEFFEDVNCCVGFLC